MQRQHTPSCPHPGSALVPLSRFLSIVPPFVRDPVQLAAPPASCFGFAAVSSERRRLGDPVHAAVFGARVPPAEHPAGGPGSPGASWVEGRCLDIVQSGEMRESGVLRPLYLNLSFLPQIFTWDIFSCEDFLCSQPCRRQMAQMRVVRE